MVRLWLLQLNVTRVVLLDTGNLVLRNANSSSVWQSFDSPTDTLLPGQAFNAASNVTLYSWLKRTDWSESKYTLNWTSHHTLNAIWNSPYPWSSTVAKDYWSYSTPSLSAVLTSKGLFQATNASGLTGVIGNSSDSGLSNRLRRVTFDVDGNLRMYSWLVGTSTNWSAEWAAISDVCTIYGLCGPFSVCLNEGECSCPSGFQFVDPNDPSQGCTRLHPVTLCTSADQTLSVVDSVDYPNGGDYGYYSAPLSTCLTLCENSCFCQAVSVSTYTTGGNHSCWLKKDYLLNGQYNNQRITYIRIAQTAQSRGLSKVQKFEILAGTLGLVVIILGASLCIIGCFFVRQRIRLLRLRQLEKKWTNSPGTVIRFTYDEIELMTRNFAEEIGRGGSGSVFKGTIGAKVVVAVKRLEKLSPEETEFVNEVDIIGRIHHANLVDLHGYCSEGAHRVLVYEYMDRGSLDNVLFRAQKSRLPILEWRSRFKIALETAKGLAYLHEDVRGQCIIHCDIKPENILLNSMLSSKVGDFGLARIMNKEQTRTMTMHIRGTCGYLAPEWTSDHMAITAKTDVYSYGMVLLEIISGRRNLKIQDMDVDAADWYFPLWAFSKVETGAFLEVVDPLLSGIVDGEEAERALQVAFWCINDKPHLRPSMAKVVQFLEGHVPVDLPVVRPLFLEEGYGPSQHIGSPAFTMSSSEKSESDSLQPSTQDIVR